MNTPGDPRRLIFPQTTEASVRQWWRIAWHPIAIPVAFVLAVWSAAGIHPTWLVRPVLVVTVVSLLTVLAFSALLRDRDRGGLAAQALLLALLVDNYAASLILCAVIVVIVLEAVANRGRAWPRGAFVTRALTVFGAALLAVTVVTTVQNGTFAASVDEVRRDLDVTAPPGDPDLRDPDIVVILLDAFPGDGAAEVATSLGLEYDRESFPRALDARGFDVLRNSHTNYLLTRLVLPAMFSGAHIADLPVRSTGNNATDARLLRHLTRDSPVLRELAVAGYVRIAIGSGWTGVGLDGVDREIHPPQLHELETILIQTTGVGNVLGAIAPDVLAADKRARITTTFAAAEAALAMPRHRPRFLFVHVPAPHIPAVFGPGGAEVNGGLGTAPDHLPTSPPYRREEAALELGQAEDIAGRVVALLDRMERRQPEPVVLVFSDHGPAFGFNGADPLGSDLRSRVSNFVALRSPGHPGLLPPGTTLVNVLPRVLNAYLGTALPIQQDSLWAWREGGSVLDLVEIDPVTLQPVGEAR